MRIVAVAEIADRTALSGIAVVQHCYSRRANFRDGQF